MENDDPFLTIQTPKFSVRFTVGAHDDPETVEYGDALITAPDGNRWSATFMTPSHIAEIMDRWATTGESLSGQYFQIYDLVIVREGGLNSMVRALEDIFDSYGMNTNVLPQLGPVDILDEDDEDDESESTK